MVRPLGSRQRLLLQTPIRCACVVYDLKGLAVRLVAVHAQVQVVESVQEAPANAAKGLLAGRLSRATRTTRLASSNHLNRMYQR